MGYTLPEHIIKLFLEQGIWKNQLSSRLVAVSILMLMASAVIWIFVGRSKKDYQIVSLYWLACGLSVWVSLHFPSRWIIPASMLEISVLSFLWAYVPVVIYHRRYNRAWPANLEFLTKRYKPFSGLITSLSAMALIIFFLGLCYITSLVTVICSSLMGIALLISIHYEFRSESAMAGLVLISQAIVSCFIWICLFFVGLDGSVATIVNLSIIPLAVLAVFWIWLGRIWKGQIIAGQPLTTTAKMYFLTNHIGIMLLGFATLMGIKLSFWPIISAVSTWDNSGTRFILMSVAYFVLIVGNMKIASYFHSFSLTVLVVINLFCACLAFATRMPVFFRNYFLPNILFIAGGFSLAIIFIAFVFQIQAARSERTGEKDGNE